MAGMQFVYDHFSVASLSLSASTIFAPQLNDFTQSNLPLSLSVQIPGGGSGVGEGGLSKAYKSHSTIKNIRSYIEQLGAHMPAFQLNRILCLYK